MFSTTIRKFALSVTLFWFCLILFLSGACIADVGEGAPSANDDKIGTLHDDAAKDYVEGRYDQALEGFTAAISLNPMSSTAYYNRGSVYFAKRQYDLAIKDFDEAIRLSPSFVYAYMNRGSAFSNIGRLDEALQDLDRAAQLNPKLADIFYNRAIVNVRRHDKSKAIADYVTAIKLDDDREEASAIQRRLLELIGRGTPAASLDGIVLSTSESSSTHFSRIAAEIEHGRRVEHVLRLISDACVSNGDNVQALAELAQARKWDAVSKEELSEKSSTFARLTGGWTFTDRFGTYAVIQSFVPSDDTIFVCSVTAGLGSLHLLEDFKMSFESRFEIAPIATVNSPSQTLTRYSLPRAGKRDAAVSLVLTRASSTVTIRMILGK